MVQRSARRSVGNTAQWTRAPGRRDCRLCPDRPGWHCHGTVVCVPGRRDWQRRDRRLWRFSMHLAVCTAADTVIVGALATQTASSGSAIQRWGVLQ